MLTLVRRLIACTIVACFLVCISPLLFAQGPPSCPGGVCVVSTEAQLRDALTPGGAVYVAPGDTIRFANSITLTSDMTAVQQSITIDGNGFALSGNGAYRGIVVGSAFATGGPVVTLALQNITIQNTVAQGGAGGSGAAGGGGGAGLGGALIVGADAAVTVSNVTLQSSAAIGGAGGAATGLVGGGGGGGLGGAGGAGDNTLAGGGGGVGNGAVGGNSVFPAAAAGGAGILPLSGSGANTGGGAGGAAAGGGGAVGGTGSTAGGGGIAGAGSGNGGFGGGGGGAWTFGGGAVGAGGFGGGGGGGEIGTGNGGNGGFAGGGGGGLSSAGGVAGTSAALGGNGSTSGGGGGGAALGGAIFIQSGGVLNVVGSFVVSGASVAGGGGAGGAGNGLAFGSGIYLAGASGSLQFTPAAGQTVNIAANIIDNVSAGGGPGAGWDVTVNGAAGSKTILSGSNTYAAGTFVRGGTLSVSAGANVGTAAVSVGTGATLEITGTSTFANSLAIASGSTLSVTPGRTATWSGAISGGGALNLTGGGTFALGNAANTYAGGTIVTGGSTLAVSADAALGGGGLQLGDASSSATLALSGAFVSSRSIVIGNLGGTIDTAGGTSAQLGGSLSGGAITKTGAGTLTLAGANSTSALFVNGGTLRAGAANVFSPGLLVVAGGTTADLNGFGQTVNAIAGTGVLSLSGGAQLTLGNNNSSSVFDGTIGGTGGVVKNGSGVLSLTGANTFTGGVRVNGGTLLGNTSSLSGNIVNNASVAFDQAADGTYAGAMSGAGALGKNGSGTLTLTGTNSYTGGTLVGAGTLVGTTSSLQGLILNNATLTFDQSTDGTFNGLIAGSGAVNKLGSGNLTLSGNHPFTGLLTVGAGSLTLNNGFLGGSVTVGTQGSFFGTGTLGGNLTLNGRLVLPGLTAAATAGGVTGFNTLHSAAIVPFAARDLPALVTDGDLIANQGSSLNFTVSPAGAAPILVNGRAVLNGSHFNVQINDPNPARTATYTALKALGGLSVTGTDASTQSPWILPVVTQTQSAVLITILNTLVPTTSLATSPNGIAAASGIDAVKRCTAGDLCDAVKEVLALGPGQIDPALRSLAGEIHASSLRLMLDDSRSVTDIVRSELTDAEHDSDARGTGWSNRRPWLQLGGEHTSFRTGAFSGATANAGGGASGVDYRPSGNWLAGFGGAFSLGDLALNDISGSSSLKAPRGLGYVGYRFGEFHWNSGSSVSKNAATTERDVNIHATVPDENGNPVPMSNGVDRTADSTQDGYTQDSWSELQHTRTTDDWTVDSKGGFRETRLVRRAFTETGAGAIALEGAEDVLMTREVHVDFNAIKKTGTWRPRIVVNYVRQLGDEATLTDVNFLSRVDSQFVVAGIPIPRNAFHGLFGLTLRSAQGWLFTLEYETTQASNESHNAIRFRVRTE